MNKESIQQLVRIVAYAVGGYFLGDGVIDGDTFQTAVAGAGSIAVFIWWLVWDRGRAK